MADRGASQVNMCCDTFGTGGDLSKVTQSVNGQNVSKPEADKALCTLKPARHVLVKPICLYHNWNGFRVHCASMSAVIPLRWTHPRRKEDYRTQVVRRSSIAKIWKLISDHVNARTESQSQSYISRFSNFCILTVRSGVWRAGSLHGPHCNFQECWKGHFHWQGRQLAEDPVLSTRGHWFTCSDTSACIFQVSLWSRCNGN